MNHRMVFVPLLLFLVLPAHAASKNKVQSRSVPAVPGELVVKLNHAPDLKTGVSFEKIATSLQARLFSKSIIQVRHLKTSNRFAVFHLQNSDLKNAIQILKQDDRVAYSEPNYIYSVVGDLSSVESGPNDPQFSDLWAMKNTGQSDADHQVGKAGADIDITRIWAAGVTGKKEVKVAVIDSGVDYTHPDLQENVDASLGWNFVNNTADAKDDNNHGSHCAGTIGAVGNNGVGVAGINWHVTIVPIKFLDADGRGTLDAAIQSVQFATHQGVNIMSNSWHANAFSKALYDAIAEARDHGILFVAAAGNDSNDNDVTPSYPASYELDNVISVAATDNQDHLAVFSNYGKTKVHVAAPGVKILSTWKDGSYGIMSGTSMATPHVAGIAALLLSTQPSLSYAEIKETLIRTSEPVRSLASRVVGKGRVSAFNSIHNVVAPDTTPAENSWRDVPLHIETPHPYESSKIYRYPLFVPGAKHLRVVFDTIDTEAVFDPIAIMDSGGGEVDHVSGTMSNYTSDYVDGDRGTIVFRTDDSIIKDGFKVTRVQAVF